MTSRRAVCGTFARATHSIRGARRRRAGSVVRDRRGRRRPRQEGCRGRRGRGALPPCRPRGYLSAAPRDPRERGPAVVHAPLAGGRGGSRARSRHFKSLAARSGPIRRFQFVRWMATGYATLAGIRLALAASGIYALMSLTVAQRTREIGNVASWYRKGRKASWFGVQENSPPRAIEPSGRAYSCRRPGSPRP